MNQIAFDFSVANSYPLAKQHFLRMCGLTLSLAAHQSHFQEAEKVHKQWIVETPLRALLSEYSAFKFKKDKLIINDVSFSCRAFEQIEAAAVDRVVVFILTAGDTVLETESLTELFYADLWLGAYIEAGREIIENGIRGRLSENKAQILSPSFGPGYYGMGIDQVSGFLDLLEAEKIGVRLSSNGNMLPSKSCVGMFLILGKDSGLPEKSCEYCLGGEQGCYFCKGGESK